MRICVESRRTRRSDCSINGICPIRLKKINKIKLDKLLSPRYAHTYNIITLCVIILYMYLQIYHPIAYTRFETQTEQPRPVQIRLMRIYYNTTHARTYLRANGIFILLLLLLR